MSVLKQIRLTHEEKVSPTWKKVKEQIELQLADYRRNLEADQTPEKTANLRGRIKALNSLLALETAPATQEEDAD